LGGKLSGSRRKRKKITTTGEPQADLENGARGFSKSSDGPYDFRAAFSMLFVRRKNQEERKPLKRSAPPASAERSPDHGALSAEIPSVRATERVKKGSWKKSFLRLNEPLSTWVRIQREGRAVKDLPVHNSARGEKEVYSLPKPNTLKQEPEREGIRRLGSWTAGAVLLRLHGNKKN